MSGSPPGAGSPVSQDLRHNLGTVLAHHYEIEQAIGSGGMAVVYRARDLKHDRLVALKVLRPELASQVGRDRFLQEIRLAAGLTHPHLLPVHDSGEAAGHLYFVMPCLQGESLRQRLQSDGRLPVHEAIAIARAVASALDYAHRQGVVHRDIKPENIMIHDGVALVADFGIGKALSEAEAMNLTQPGFLVGTPDYVSPERLFGDGEGDGRGDIYSLGCVLYEMLTGLQLFTASTPQALFAQRAARPMPDLEFPADVPDYVRAVVRAALAVSPDDRPATGAEFANSLAAPTAMTSRVPKATMPPGKSVAVLAFANMSADPENEYLSDGITEEIINRLAQMKDLHVAARTSSFAFKGRTADVREVGRRLGVANVLEGSVRRSGAKLRVTAQLIDATNGYHLWSQHYDRELDDVFSIQDEIAAMIADRLQIALSDRPGLVPVKPPTADMEAYQLYLKGRHLWNRRTRKALQEAVEYFEKAIARDPTYALAHSGLADAHLLLGSYMHLPWSDAIARAKAATERALDLDPTLAEAHTSRGQVLRSEHDWTGEEEAYRRAIALNPSYATAHQWYATLLTALGRFDEAIGEIRRAEELDPLSHAISVTVAVVLFCARDYEAALTQLHRALELEPDFASTHAWLGVVYAQLGRFEEVEPAVARAAELSDGNPNVFHALAWTYARTGRQQEALELVDRVTKGRAAGWCATIYATIYATYGDLDLAFELMERAVREGESSNAFFYLKVFPWYDPLRSDPRFDALLRRMNFAT
ncbi:MAG TPA: protein kinase [Gemmatimonadales bacterium]|nr:protein kinase [Gemmatimonadales bacterium]